MKSCLKPGDIAWHAEKGVVRQARVADADQNFFPNDTIITFPTDADPSQTWRCWDGFLFKSRTEALEEACNQLKKRIKDEREDIQDIRADIKRHRTQLQILQKQLQQEVT